MGLGKMGVRSADPGDQNIRTNCCFDDCSRCSLFGDRLVRVASVSGVAFLLSWLTSLAGLPEVPTEPETIEPPDEE